MINSPINVIPYYFLRDYWGFHKYGLTMQHVENNAIFEASSDFCLQGHSLLTKPHKIPIIFPVEG